MPMRPLAQAGEDDALSEKALILQFSVSFSNSFLQQPLFTVQIDGHIDNLDALTANLFTVTVTTPEEYISVLYEKSGDDVLFKLEGAFSLILYDKRRQQVILYRSFLNGPPLYYVNKNDLLSVSTNPMDLLHRYDVSYRLDTEQMSSFFALRMERWHTSVFAELSEVQHGEMVIVSEKGEQRRTKALSDVLKSLSSYGSEREMIDRYRQLLDSKVSRYIIPKKRYGIMLSSGLDSTSLAVLASQQLKERNSHLRAYSWSFPNYSEADESKKIQALCDMHQIDLTLLNVERYMPFGRVDSVSFIPDVPFVNLYWEMISILYQTASNDGIDILFNGHYGDHLYASPDNLFVDIVKDRKVKLFLSNMRGVLGHYGFMGALKYSPSLRGFIKYLLPVYKSKKKSFHTPEWLSSDAKTLFEIYREKPIISLQNDYEIFSSALAKHTTSSGIGRYFHERYGLERIEPYFDPELLNYTRRLPLYMVYHNGQTKYFAREAMRGLLPESIRMQPRVGVLNKIASDGFVKNRESVRQRLLDEPEPWSSYVDKEWMENKLKKDATVLDKELLVIWMSLTFGPWLKAIKPGGDLYEGRV